MKATELVTTIVREVLSVWFKILLMVGTVVGGGLLGYWGYWLLDYTSKKGRKNV